MATTAEKTKYIETVGRRKTSSARVRLTKNTKDIFEVNGKKLHEYFPTEELRKTIKEPFAKSSLEGAFSVTAKIIGGGIHSQAEALRLGIARGLQKFDGELRKPLKAEGLLTRDPRSKERRKFGLKKARKAPQWSKR
ncbi:MAG: 30S ribosomal protein S9 [Candidatus Vogelbacteria bacterium]|nr:30S ribosomal protein S9 [Candidatus Vogelbacteria bacterium]